MEFLDIVILMSAALSSPTRDSTILPLLIEGMPSLNNPLLVITPFL